jgi:hypothetical protein
VWVPQSQFDLRGIEGYETIFYSPIDGSAIAAVVPKDFKIIKPANSVFDGNVNLPELIPTSATSTTDKVYSFNIAGEVVPMAEAKASFARLKETLIKKQLELKEAQDKVVQTAIKTIERGDAGLESQFTKIEESMNALFPQIKANAGEIARLKKLRSKNQSQLSGSVGLSGMTDQEIALLRLSDQYDRLAARRESLAIAINIENQIPKTPQEVGFYFKIEDGQVSLIRRTLDWDSFTPTDGGQKILLTPPKDEVIGAWNLTPAELKALNFYSVKNGGYSTDWDIFKSLNAGNESVYTVNAAEVQNWATKKSFRIRDYRSTINKLRKDSGRDPIPYDPDIDNSMNLNELLKEQARIEWTNQNKARVWAQQKLNHPTVSSKLKANAQKVLEQTSVTMKELEEQIARDTDLITKILSEGYSGPEITPKLWQAIYGQVPKPEMWLEKFLNTLNTFKKTNVSLMDDAISKLDIIDSPYPVATVDEWGELPMGTPDSAIPEEVLDAMNKKKTDELLDIYTTGNSQKTKPNLPKKNPQLLGKTIDASKVFVFGSNLAGRHGKGAALEAKERYGAVYGQGVGFQGQSYAIPTKGNKLEKLTPEQIKPYVDEFVTFVKENPNIEFGLTDIGLGLADNKPEVIASLFNEVPSNITFITKNSRLKAALIEQGKVKNDNI